jgi:integrase
MVDHFSTYIYQKRGFYYFSRRVPKEVQHCHAKKRIVLALNTRSRAKALRHSQVICQRLDEKWLPIRLDAMGLGNVLTNDVSQLAAPTLSEAVQTYLQLKGAGKPKTFHGAAMRNAQVVIDILGDRPISEYSTVDAGKVRDALIDGGLAILSVRRSFTTIKAIINLAIAEHGLDIRNPFSAIYMPDAGSKKRVSIPVDTIRQIQQSCMKHDDDMRWLVALISDTGMRLAEAAGLHMDDLKLDDDIPYVDIKPHTWRSLKTKGSQRQVPLVGASLWAAQRIKANTSSCFAFDRYTDNSRCNANSASNALNKWIQANFRDDIVMHGFRHAMRDRLRAVSCPSEIIDQIGGWSPGKVGEGYGNGFDLRAVANSLEQKSAVSVSL